MSATRSQQLHGSNIAPDIDGALQARTKDALWFLARQWQLGEFEAENGGMPVRVHVAAKVFPLSSCTLDGRTTSLNLHAPLEAQIEAELNEPDADSSVKPPAWHSASLEYGFSLSTTRHQLVATGYDGRALDWHDFSVASTQVRPGQEVHFDMIPGQLQIRGVPEQRFWEIEDRAAYFDSGESAEPNILSVMLPEFFYTDMKNWFSIPAPMPSGSVREVEKVVVIDSFGIATEVDPAGQRSENDQWSVFALDQRDSAPTDTSVLMCLHTAARVGENDLIEEVRFLRDEAANLVWGWERQLTDPKTGLFTTVLEPREDVQDQQEPPKTDLRFRLKSETAQSFIPYVPRHTETTPAVDGDISLRRARSDEAYSSKNPQYRGAVIAEAPYLNEEDIPRSGIRIRRTNRFARGSDDQVYFWVGRDKDVARPTRKPNLSFDDLVKVEK